MIFSGSTPFNALTEYSATESIDKLVGGSVQDTGREFITDAHA